jgi:hypothetical protein
MNTSPIVAWLVLFFAAYGAHPARCRVASACTDAEVAERADFASVRRAAAEAVVGAAFDPGERPLRSGAHARSWTALEVAALAAHETGLRPRLWRNECHTLECDEGRAVGAWQIHVGDGLHFVSDRLEPCPVAEGPDCLDRQDLVDDPGAGARVALRMLRAGGLPLFTGQGPDGRAVQWVEGVVASWYETHPPPVDDATAMRPERQP